MIMAKSTNLLISINRSDTPLTCQIEGWQLLSQPIRQEWDTPLTCQIEGVATPVQSQNFTPVRGNILTLLGMAEIKVFRKDLKTGSNIYPYFML